MQGNTQPRVWRPPREIPCSTSTVDAPFLAALMAAAVPAEPPPTTQTSASNNTGKSASLKSTEEVGGATASAFGVSDVPLRIAPAAVSPASFMKLRREMGIENDFSTKSPPFVLIK